MKRLSLLPLLLVWLVGSVDAQARMESQFRIGRLKYSGGGDWYNDPSAEVNLLRFAKQQAGVDSDPRYEFVELSSDRLFTYSFLFMTGHGNVVFSQAEADRLRLYLERGGFLYVDDDYGLDKAFRRELAKVMPGAPLVEIPFDHPIYRIPFSFPNGVPKTHEHDNKPSRGYGLFVDGRLSLFYSVESNPSDGWVDAEIHGDPEAVRLEALRFGTNLIVWALTR
ncbi:MAG: DUF4159 domain-containing protein [Bacteroidetes bacterium]|nr:DUF4159 domain-containing protein [Bacteroidota bacterium]